MLLQLKCCGAVGPVDYRFSAWHNHTKVREAVFVPASCCVQLDESNYDACQISAIISPVHSGALRTKVSIEVIVTRATAEDGCCYRRIRTKAARLNIQAINLYARL